jgi:hypothetical protein
MGRVDHDWQERDYVLGRFGNAEKTAIREYHEFVKARINEGRKPELVGGGLIRSMGGWSEVVSKRRRGIRELTDERILGSGAFVEQILRDADEKAKEQLMPEIRTKTIAGVIEEICEKKGITVQELRAGGRRAEVSHARREIALILVQKYGISFAEIARNVGVTTSGIYRILERKRHEST